jgi:hypothetical protein
MSLTVPLPPRPDNAGADDLNSGGRSRGRSGYDDADGQSDSAPGGRSGNGRSGHAGGPSDDAGGRSGGGGHAHGRSGVDDARNGRSGFVGNPSDDVGPGGDRAADLGMSPRGGYYELKGSAPPSNRAATPTNGRGQDPLEFAIGAWAGLVCGTGLSGGHR